MNIKVTFQESNLDMTMHEGDVFEVGLGGTGKGDYSKLKNKPSINGVTLEGNKTATQLRLVSQADIEDLEYYIDSGLGSQLELILNLEEEKADKRQVDNTSLYYDVMGKGTTSKIAGRYFVVDKNTVTITVDGSSTTHRVCNLFGQPTAYAFTWPNVDLSGDTFYALDLSDDTSLVVTAKWETVNTAVQNNLCVATKNSNTGVITKGIVASDNVSLIQSVDLLEVLPEIRANNNFALYYESYRTAYPNKLTYWIATKENDQEYIFGDTNSKLLLASRRVQSSTDTAISILHFSDIHSDGSELGRILNYINANSAYISDAICTGDMSAASYSSDFTFWQAHDVSKILVALGNHDYYVNNTDDHSKTTIENVMQRWIGDYASGWNVTRPNNASYYYKDYANKLRLIVLDCNLTANEGGTEQKTWLSTVLSDALSNELAVIIATHFVYLGANKTFTTFDHKFTSAFAPRTIEFPYDWSPMIYTDAVQTFIDGGGAFVCWLSGHTHADIMMIPTEYPKQLIVSICAASPSRSYPTRISNDLYREEKTAMADAFNIVTIDTMLGVVKIVRIGANRNNYMTLRDCTSYDYFAHEFINGENIKFVGTSLVIGGD